MWNQVDQEMARRCLQGNETAWTEFMQSHRRRVIRMSYRFARCRTEAEDLTQDVFVRIYQTLSSYRGEAGSLSGWLMRVARNLFIDHYRRTRRDVRCDPIGEMAHSVHDPHAPNPLQCLTRNETEGMVHAALRILAPEVRNVLVLHDLEGLTLHEVATVLRVPEGTVKSRMVRGRRELASVLRNTADQGFAKMESAVLRCQKQGR